MTKNFVPFWTWNKRVSHGAGPAARRPSGKAPFGLRVMQSLCGVPFTYAQKKEARRKSRELKRRIIIANRG